MITLKQIAERAGVSTATVSYVINGSKKVSETTRQRVQKIIEETGYQSNIFARSLRCSRTNLIGVIVEDMQAKHSPAIIDGITQEAEKQGYQIILSNLRLISKIGAEFDHMADYSEDIRKAGAMIESMRVDGVIYVGMHDREIPHMISEIKDETVYCYCYSDRKARSVCYDDEESSCELARMFLDAGIRRIGIIAGREDSEPSERRLRGILRALREAGIEEDPDLIRHGNWKYENAREIADDMLRRKDRPRGIMALNDEMALGVRDAALSLRLSIPGDLSLSGFDNSAEIRYVLPHITTVDRPLHRMGVRAVEMLTDSIRRPERESVKIQLPCRIVRGESIAEARH